VKQKAITNMKISFCY